MMLAYVELPTILAIVSLVATAATLLSTKKPKVAALDDKLQSQATQGAYIPLIIGRGRVGSVFCSPPADHQAALTSLAPQNRSSLGSLFGFAKGQGGIPQQPSYQEDSLHIVCVGPASELIAIFQNGETIWRGPITPATHPSGSAVLLSNGEGAFIVYWGFPTDPPISVVDVNSRFSHCLKIYWSPKNLGQQRQWPRLEYEVRCPCYSQIASTASEVPLEGDDAHPTWAEWEILNPYVGDGQAADDRIQFGIRCSNAAKREIALWDNPPGLLNIEDTPAVTSTYPTGGIVKIRSQSALPNSFDPEFPDSLT